MTDRDQSASRAFRFANAAKLSPKERRDEKKAVELEGKIALMQLQVKDIRRNRGMRPMNGELGRMADQVDAQVEREQLKRKLDRQHEAIAPSGKPAQNDNKKALDKSAGKEPVKAQTKADVKEPPRAKEKSAGGDWASKKEYAIYKQMQRSVQQRGQDHGQDRSKSRPGGLER